MKKLNIINLVAAVAMVSSLSSCDDLLDRSPQSTVTPDQYFDNAEQMRAYVMPMYENLMNASALGNTVNAEMNLYRNTEKNTDNGHEKVAQNMFLDGSWLVPQSSNKSNGSTTAWFFDDIYDVNYFITKVQAKFDDGELNKEGNSEEWGILGEAYFFRAYYYFDRLVYIGDYPIITEVFGEDMEALAAASERAPRNEVARFILADLDRAIDMIPATATDGGRRNLLSKNVAYLLKSRVALFEASWLKNFNGTAFVPGGPGWPGADKDYNKGFAYKAGTIEDEIKFFLEECMAASKVVAKVGLTENNHIIGSTVYLSDFLGSNDETVDGVKTSKAYAQYITDYNAYLKSELTAEGRTEEAALVGDKFGLIAKAKDFNDPSVYLRTPYAHENPFFAMFSDYDLSGYPEVLMWREYNRDLIGKNINYATGKTMRAGTGAMLSHQYIMAALDENGLPRYDIPLRVESDRMRILIGTDERIQLFVGQVGSIFSSENVTKQKSNYTIGIPALQYNCYTGYSSRKGMDRDFNNLGNGNAETGGCMFRAAEAYMNYVEADFLLNGSISAESADYWNAIRKRGIGDKWTPYTDMVAALDLDKEAINDWAVYTAGQKVSKLEFAIRKERRVEFQYEGLREMDLNRWRAKDQLMTSNPLYKDYPFKHIHGIALHYQEGTPVAETGTGKEKLWNQLLLENSNYNMKTDSGSNNWEENTFPGRVSVVKKDKDGKPEVYSGNSYTISAPKDGMHIRPLAKSSKDAAYDGYQWHMAHYLRPIEIEHMLITASDVSDLSTSPIYQNPGWPAQASLPATY